MNPFLKRSCLVLSILVLPLVATACGQTATDARVAEMESTGEQQPATDDVAHRDAPAADLNADTMAPATTRPATTRTAPQAPPAPAAPVAPPQPRYVTVDVPAGTTIDVEILDMLSSGTSVAGDPVRARLASDLYAGDRLVAPAGAELTATVSEAVPLKNFGGQPKLAVGFSGLQVVDGGTAELTAFHTAVGKKQAARDAAKIGGAAAAGAIIGHQVDDDKGKLVGAILGGAAGTAAAAKTGKEVEIPAGTVVVVTLESNFQVRLES
jgi:hypothetical protein